MEIVWLGSPLTVAIEGPVIGGTSGISFWHKQRLQVILIIKNFYIFINKQIS
jgi:hypothetical protein